MCFFRKSRTPKYARCSNGVAVKATNEVYCLAPHLFSQSLTAQRIFAIKTRRTNNQAAVSQDYLLGEAHFVRKRKILSQFSACHWEEQRSCDVAIQRSEMRLRLDSHANARNDIWKIQIFRNPNEVWISSCQNARYHHEVISSPMAISLLYTRRSPNTWGRGKVQIQANFLIKVKE